MLPDTGSIISNIWDQIQLSDALNSLVTSISSQVATMIPIGIGLIAVLSAPRIVKRLIHTFI